MSRAPHPVGGCELRTGAPAFTSATSPHPIIPQRSTSIYVLEPCQVGNASLDYQVIATTKTGTFEKELNAAAAKGLRFVPESLIAIEKKALLGAYNIETVGVVRQSAAADPVTYRVLAAVRLGTLAKELEAAGTEGFRVVAFTIGPKESVLVLEKR